MIIIKPVNNIKKLNAIDKLPIGVPEKISTVNQFDQHTSYVYYVVILNTQVNHGMINSIYRLNTSLTYIIVLNLLVPLQTYLCLY